MSICAALVYIQKDGLCFGFVTFHFSSFRFGLSSEVRAKTLVFFLRGSPTFYILFDLLYLY